MATTIKDIARLAGVTAATVSKVLNRKDQSIGEQTREKIWSLVKELNYTPNSIALFYSFADRAAHRFDAHRLLGTGPERVVTKGFWRAFFGAAEASTDVLDSSANHASARRRG